MCSLILNLHFMQKILQQTFSHSNGGAHHKSCRNLLHVRIRSNQLEGWRELAASAWGSRGNAKFCRHKLLQAQAQERAYLGDMHKVIQAYVSEASRMQEINL